ncbi:MAG: phasin family protein [Pseudomonadota bacterium]
MQNEFIDLIAKSTESGLETARKLSELNMRTFEMLLQQQSAMLNAYMDLATKSLEIAGKAKGVQELVEGQTQLGREFGERGMDLLKKNMAAMNEAGNEYGTLVQDSLKSAQSQFTTAAKAAQKKAA